MTPINRPFVGIPSFLRAPVSTEPDALARAAIAVLGVPFDEGSPFLPGSRMGPRAIREHTLRFPPDGLYDVETGRSFLAHELSRGLVLDTGDVDIRPANPARTFELIAERVRAIAASGAFPVVLGGDHSITWPVFQGLGRPAHVVQFDAHQDVSPADDELQRTNSHAFRHIIGMEDCLSLTQVGIRGYRNPRAHVEEIRGLGHRVLGMGETRRLGPEGIAALLPAGAPVFVSIDVDALDMSIVPGCVSAEPDGLTYPELMAALEALAVRCDVVGFDFVEVNPPLDVATGATAYLGAVVTCGFLGFIAAQPRWRERLAARGLLD
jgi:agmatinase